jgi:hypothetical protein
MGAFMATAITDWPPLDNEVRTLLGAIANRTTDFSDGPGPTGELR